MSCFCHHRESQLEPPSRVPIPESPAFCDAVGSCAEDFAVLEFSCPAPWLSFQFPGIAALGNIADISSGLFTLAQRLHTDIIFLILVDFPMHRSPGGIGSVHLALLRLAQTAQFVRGQFCLAKSQMLVFSAALSASSFSFFFWAWTARPSLSSGESVSFWLTFPL